MEDQHPCPSPAEACYRQRRAISEHSARLKALRAAIADPVNLNPPQWAQWFAYACDYKPELIVELGRGKGNSTAAFAEALRRNGAGRLVSLCLSEDWERDIRSRLAPLVEPGWFDPLDVRRADLREVDFEPLVGGARRVLVLWDAHGFEVAEAVLGRLLPLLQDRSHMVLMHDISDIRYGGARAYSGAGLWQGMRWVEMNDRYECRLHLGWMDTVVDQAIAVVDFLGRNGLELRSADDSLYREIGEDAGRLREMRSLLSAEDFDLRAHWAYFSLNAGKAPFTFPAVLGGSASARRPPFMERLRAAARVLRG